MLDRLLGKLSGSDALVRASQGSDRQAFADLFIRSSILFLHLPPGLEDGLDPNGTQDGLLAQIKKSARDCWARLGLLSQKRWFKKWLLRKTSSPRDLPESEGPAWRTIHSRRC
jgi:hypothetical protein